MSTSEGVAEAVRAATALEDRLVGLLDGTLYRDHPAPPWLRDWETKHRGAMLAGEGLVCEHFGPPQVYHAAVWRPGVMVCAACAEDGALTLGLTEEEQYTCDACRQHHPGKVASTVFRSGMVMIWCGLCRTCRAQYYPDPPVQG